MLKSSLESCRDCLTQVMCVEIKTAENHKWSTEFYQFTEFTVTKYVNLRPEICEFQLLRFLTIYLKFSLVLGPFIALNVYKFQPPKSLKMHLSQTF